MTILIGIVIVAAVGYYISLRSHPYTKCRVCNGSGKHFGSVFTTAHRKCGKCNGTGRLDRLGTRFLT